MEGRDAGRLGLPHLLSRPAIYVQTIDRPALQPEITHNFNTYLFQFNRKLRQYVNKTSPVKLGLPHYK